MLRVATKSELCYETRTRGGAFWFDWGAPNCICWQLGETATTGSEGHVGFESLRGAEATLFHVTSRIRGIVAGFATDQIQLGLDKEVDSQLG